VKEAKTKKKVFEHQFSHIDESGAARMVDVSAKSETKRVAVARGEIELGPKIAAAVAAQSVEKGDVLGVARVAGIMAAKNASRIIPLSHPLFLSACEVNFELDSSSSRLTAICRVVANGLTGVEMEALCGVSGALLTVYDMCKAIDKAMVIGPIRLLEKSGGKSGLWQYKEAK
jgi:cyclic pyranopterin phosphate synthase